MKRWIVGIALLACLGCTAQQRARNFGGSTTETLPVGQKLVVATWKEDDLWILTRAWREGDVAEAYTFRESSSFGIMEGTVRIIETAPTEGR